MKYSIVRADIKNDKDEIVALLKRNFSGSPEARYCWIYENNPGGFALCWLAKVVENSSVIGSTALFPRRLFIKGKYTMAGINGDLCVDKEHRGSGLAVLLQKSVISSCNKSNLIMFYGYPNKQAEPVHKKAGIRILGDIYRMSKPFKCYYLLKNYIYIPVITKMLSNLVDIAFRFLSKETYYKATNEFTYEVSSSFDNRFDIFWENVSTKFQIIGERSSSYLNWRYAFSPHKVHRFFALIKKESREIVGYIIFHKDRNKISIDDLLCFDMDEVFDVLLSSFLKYQREDDIDLISISFAGNQVLIDKLKEFGFSIRDREGKVIIYSSDAHLLQNLLEIENWYLLPGDGDI